jgi:hypothetical protein
MARTPLQKVVQDWQTRASVAQSQGIPESVYSGLAKQDITTVARGGTQLPADQVYTALQSAIRGAPVISPPQSDSFSIGGLLSNAGTDVGDIIRNFIPGVVKTAWHLPSELQAVPGDLSQGWAGVAKDPLLSLIPGVHDVADLAQGDKGDEDLYQHPVGALLDVLPMIGTAGRMAADAGMVGEAGEAGSAAEALSQGSPVKALYRAATPQSLQDAITQRASNLTLTQTERGLARAFSLEGKLASSAQHTFDRYLREGVLQKVDRADRAALIDVAMHRGDPDYDAVAKYGEAKAAQFEVIIEDVDRVQDQLGRVAEGYGGAPKIKLPDGTEERFHEGSPVLKAHKVVQRRERQVADARDRAADSAATVTKWHAAMSAKAGKVRHFMEDDASYSARPAGEVGVDAVRSALQPFYESFAELTPEHIYSDVRDAMADGRLTIQGARAVRNDIRVVQSRVQALSSALDHAATTTGKESRDAIRVASRNATVLHRLFRKRTWDVISHGSSFRTFMEGLRKDLQGVATRDRAHQYAVRMYESSRNDLAEKQALHSGAMKKLQSANERFADKLHKNPPVRFIPLVGEVARQGLRVKAEELGVLTPEIEDQIMSSSTMQQVKEAVGEDEFDRIVKSSKQMWQTLAAAGHNPVWVHLVEPKDYESVLNVRPMAERVTALSIGKARADIFNQGVNDIAAAVTDAGGQLIERIATERFHSQFVQPLVKTGADLDKEYGERYDLMTEKRRAKLSSQHMTKNAWVARRVAKDYKKYDPTQWGLSSARLSRGTDEYVSVGVYNSLHLMQGNYGPIKLLTGKNYNRSMNLYKFSVLTGPRHLVHVAIGGAMFAMLREPRTFAELGRAARMVQDHAAPVELLHNIYNLNHDEQGAAIYSYKAGSTLGRIFKTVSHRPAQFEEWVGNVERVATYLSASKRGLDNGAALKAALKVYIDMDGMSPAERVIIKQVFPFYAFTQHIFRYLFTYPVDYPYRAAILSRFAEHEQEEWNTGLPSEFQELLYLGSPSATGDQWAVDYKNINPFRSIASDFSLAGFTASLSPFVTAPLQAMGVNVLQGSADLYPGVDYDPVTGSLVAQNTNIGETTIESFIPETQGLTGIAALFGMTGRMKSLKESDPSAFYRTMFDAFNLPFATTQQNVPYEEEHSELNIFRTAQTAASTAEETGDWGTADQYNLIPYAGELIPPSLLQQAYAALQGSLTGQTIDGQQVSAKAVTPKVTDVKSPILTVREVG